MGWQDIAVWVVVGSAVLFLVGRNVNLRKRRTKPAETFIPLSSLKKPASPDQAGEDHCH